MGWGLRGFEVIDVNGRLHVGHDPIDLARPFAHVPDGDDRRPKATTKHDKSKNGTKCADSGAGASACARAARRDVHGAAPFACRRAPLGVCARARHAATDSAEVRFADAVKIDTVTPSSSLLAKAWR